MKAQSARMLAAISVLLLLALNSASAQEPGSFILDRNNNRYSLRANEAPVSEVLQQVEQLTGVPIFGTPEDESFVTANVRDVSFEQLINHISDGYAIVYQRDPDTGQLRPLHVTAAPSVDAPASVTQAVPVPATAEDLTTSILQRRDTIRSYRQQATVTTSEMGVPVTLEGNMWVDGERFRSELVGPPGNTLRITVSDGTVIHSYEPVMNVVQTINRNVLQQELGREAGRMHDPASNPNPFAVVDRATLQYLGPDEMAGETVYVLRGQLAPAALDAAAVLPTAPRYVRIWVGASDGMPRRVVYLQDGGEEMLRQEFQNVVIDAAMDQALFDFVPPPDAQVIDLTPAIVALSRTE